MAEAMIHKEQAEGRWDASVNVGYMRQDFGYDLRGLTARAARGRSRMSFSMSAPACRSRCLCAIGTRAILRQRWRLRRPRSAAWRRSCSLSARRSRRRSRSMTPRSARWTSTRRGCGNPRARTWRSSARPIRWDAPRCMDVIAEQRRYIDIETGYTEALKQAYDAAVDIERPSARWSPEERKRSMKQQSDEVMHERPRERGEASQAGTETRDGRGRGRAAGLWRAWGPRRLTLS